MALEVSDRLQGSQCAASEVSRQPWGLRVLGYGGSGEPQGPRVAPGVLQWPLGISGQLDTEVSMRLQGSQDSPGVSQCLGLGSQEGPKVLGWLQMSYSGPGTLIAAGHWGLRVTPGVSMQPQGSQGSPGVSQCLGMGAQESPKVLGWLQVSYSGPGILIAAGH